jgi:hypothetical protein
MNPLKWNMNVPKILFVIFRVHINLFLKDISISVILPAQKKPFLYITLPAVFQYHFHPRYSYCFTFLQK